VFGKTALLNSRSLHEPRILPPFYPLAINPLSFHDLRRTTDDPASSCQTW